MGTTLTGTTPQDTYDSLIKVTDNGPLTGSLKKLTDGLGNDSSLSLSTAAASLSGTLAVTGNATLTSNGVSVRLGSATANAGANILIAGASSNKNWSIGVQQNISGGLEFTPTATNGGLTLGTTPAMVVLDNGNVGIGTSNPVDGKLCVTGATAAGNSIVQTYLTVAAASTRVTADGRYAIGLDGADGSTERVSVTVNGLTFNGDTAAANALDDYEEGTWTMGVTFGGASVGVTASSNTGTYTKIGRQVTVNGILVLSSKGSSTGDALLTGLPFTIPNFGAHLPPATLWLNRVTFLNQHQAVGKLNTTSVEFWDITTLGATAYLNNTDFANNSEIIINMTYFV
jgi:hypothetical protein